MSIKNHFYKFAHAVRIIGTIVSRYTVAVVKFAEFTGEIFNTLNIQHQSNNSVLRNFWFRLQFTEVQYCQCSYLWGWYYSTPVRNGDLPDPEGSLSSVLSPQATNFPGRCSNTITASVLRVPIVSHSHGSSSPIAGSQMSLLTVGAHPQRGLQYVLGLCVCVSVTQHLTSHMIIHATNDTNLLSGGWRSKILSDFLCKCFIAKLERFLLVLLYDKSVIFYSAENAHVYESGHIASGHFVLTILGETFFGSSIIACWPLAVSMPLTKVCPQCKAAVPVRRKTCERCDLVFWFKRKTECNLREKTV